MTRVGRFGAGVLLGGILAGLVLYLGAPDDAEVAASTSPPTTSAVPAPAAAPFLEDEEVLVGPTALLPRGLEVEGGGGDLGQVCGHRDGRISPGHHAAGAVEPVEPDGGGALGQAVETNPGDGARDRLDLRPLGQAVVEPEHHLCDAGAGVAPLPVPPFRR